MEYILYLLIVFEIVILYILSFLVFKSSQAQEKISLQNRLFYEFYETNDDKAVKKVVKKIAKKGKKK